MEREPSAPPAELLRTKTARLTKHTEGHFDLKVNFGQVPNNALISQMADLLARGEGKKHFPYPAFHGTVVHLTPSLPEAFQDPRKAKRNYRTIAAEQMGIRIKIYG